jgi:hypothetical protein
VRESSFSVLVVARGVIRIARRTAAVAGVFFIFVEVAACHDAGNQQRCEQQFDVEVVGQTHVVLQRAVRNWTFLS